MILIKSSVPQTGKIQVSLYVNMLKPYREKAPAQGEDMHPTLMVMVISLCL